MVLVVVFGAVGFLNLRSSLFPEQPIQFIMIEASYLGASPEEMEEGVVVKIEDNLKGVSGIEKTTSVSQENLAVITVELQTTANSDRVLQDIKNEIDKITTFPPNLERLVVYQQEVLNFTANFALSGDVSLRVLKETARRIEEDFLNSGYISKISLSGFPAEEIEISVREADLRAYGLTFTELSEAVRANNLEITAGIIRGPERNIIIRATDKEYFANDLRDLVVRTGEGGSLVRLRDVADVRDKWADDPNRTYLNSIRSVIIEIHTTNEEDLLEAADYAKNYMARFNEEHPQLTATLINDGSKSLRDRLNLLLHDGIMGAILVLIFLGAFLNLRVAFFVAMGIPISFLGMFAVAAAYGLTINLLSLFGMIIVVGILVDDGVVVGENIYQRFEDGDKPVRAAIKGTMEVLPSITSGVTTTAIAFSLFFFLEGRTGDFFSDISFVVVVSLIMSLIEVFFFLPPRLARTKALAEKNRKPNKFLHQMDKVMNFLRDGIYMPVLKFTLQNKTFNVLLMLALMIFTFNAIGAGFIRTTFFPQIEMDRLNVILELEPGTNDTITERYLSRIEEAVWQVSRQYAETDPENRQLVTDVEKNIGPNTHMGNLVVYLLDPELRTIKGTEASARIRAAAGEIPEAQRLEYEAGIPFGKPVAISLAGRNLDELRSAMNELKQALREMPELTDVVDNEEKGQPEVHLTLRPEAKRLGLTLEQVVSQVRQGFFGQEAQRLQRGLDEVIVWVRYDFAGRRHLHDLENMRIRSVDGNEYPLIEVAEVTLTEGVLAINHLNGQREITVEADIAHPDVSVPDVTDRIRNKILPGILERHPGISTSFEGQAREFARTMNSVLTVLPAVLVLMIAMMVFTFKSFNQAFILFIIVPFAFIGSAWGHVVHGLPISLFSGLGFIALAGILVNDGLVFINTFNDQLRGGTKYMDALLYTGASRFRPIFLTTITTIGGLGPLIFNPSLQAQFLIPMAITVAYGLLIGSILTLTLLPTFLVIENRIKVYLQYWWTGKKPASEEVEHAVTDKQFDLEHDEI